MIPVLPTVVVGVALVAACYAGWLVVRNRLADVPLLIAAGIVELVLLGQAVVGVVALAGTDRPVQAAVFVGYLVTSLLVVPAGLVWGLLEHSRWGPAVVAVGFLVVPVLVLRMQTVWRAGG